MYSVTPALTTLLQNAHSATAGFFWLMNPASSGKLLVIRGLDVEMSQGGGTVAVTSPILSVERMSFSGAIGGNATTVCKSITDDVAAVGDLRDAAPGTPVAGSVWTQFTPVGMQSASAMATPVRNPFRPESPLVLKSGEGIVLRQSTAGTASDTRKFSATIFWAEVTRLSLAEATIYR